MKRLLMTCLFAASLTQAVPHASDIQTLTSVCGASGVNQSVYLDSPLLGSISPIQNCIDGMVIGCQLFCHYDSCAADQTVHDTCLNYCPSAIQECVNPDFLANAQSKAFLERKKRAEQLKAELEKDDQKSDEEIQAATERLKILEADIAAVEAHQKAQMQGLQRQMDDLASGPVATTTIASEEEDEGGTEDDAGDTTSGDEAGASVGDNTSTDPQDNQDNPQDNQDNQEDGPEDATSPATETPKPQIPSALEDEETKGSLGGTKEGYESLMNQDYDTAQNHPVPAPWALPEDSGPIDPEKVRAQMEIEKQQAKAPTEPQPTAPQPQAPADDTTDDPSQETDAPDDEDDDGAADDAPDDGTDDESPDDTADDDGDNQDDDAQE